MKIIPAIDIINGKCVRLTKGDYATKKIYSENPLEMAKKFEASGIQYLHLVDLDGAKNGFLTHHKLLEKIAAKTKLKIDFGGGIKQKEDVVKALEFGASQVNIGSMAIQQPELFLDILQCFGAEKIILSADCKNRKVASNAWQENSTTDVFEFIQNYFQKGVKHVVSTDIDCDGILKGPAVGLYQEILTLPKLNLIASGGVASVEDISVLDKIGCAGVIVGKAIYENRIKLKELVELC